jgi:hypothetical protein
VIHLSLAYTFCSRCLPWLMLTPTLQNKPAVKKDGTTKAATLSFRRLTLTPVTVTATGLQPVTTSDKIVLSLAAKVPKGGKLVPQTTLLFPIQGESYAPSLRACSIWYHLACFVAHCRPLSAI